METTEKLLLELFRDLGEKASYHFADTSFKEWEMGRESMQYAINLYNDHPELREQMNRISKAFSWNLDTCKKCKWYH